jgi:multidrug efflux pump
MKPFEAALQGAREIGFTVFAISVSLIAVFIPLLLMQGLVGRLFREFAVTLSVAIGVSMIVSLTTTPMMAAHLLRHQQKRGWLYSSTERGFNAIVKAYGKALNVVLRHSFVTLLILAGTVALNVYLFVQVPKGFFPQQDTGRLSGAVQADQDTSFQQMDKLLRQYVDIIGGDPAIDTVNGFTGGGRGGATNSARLFIALKPLDERKATAEQIIARLRPALAKVPGATLFLTSVQDLRVGGRQSNIRSGSPRRRATE